jgi:hypothetical protein
MSAFLNLPDALRPCVDFHDSTEAPRIIDTRVETGQDLLVGTLPDAGYEKRGKMKVTDSFFPFLLERGAAPSSTHLSDWINHSA